MSYVHGNATSGRRPRRGTPRSDATRHPMRMLKAMSTAAIGVVIAAAVASGGGDASVAHADGLDADVVVYDAVAPAEPYEAPAPSVDVREGEIGDEETNAFRVYSILKAAGCSDTNVAAVLSCMEKECGLDPTTVEAIYSEPFRMGPMKTSAMGDINSFTAGPMAEAYGGWGNLDQMSYCYRGAYWAGLGLGSFTGEGCYRLLAAADAYGYEWYDAGFQMAVALAYGESAGEQGIDDYIASDHGDVYDACYAFMRDFEGVPSATDSHSVYAEGWLDAVSGWTPDLAYGGRYVGLARQMRADGAPS